MQRCINKCTNCRVDFFSLDIEGAEMAVLKTIPFDKVDIEVFLIEVSILAWGVSITTADIAYDHLIPFEIYVIHHSTTTFIYFLCFYIFLYFYIFYIFFLYLSITTADIGYDHLILFEIYLIHHSSTTFQTDKTNVTQMTAFMSSVGYEMTPMPPYDHLFIKKY